MPILPPRREPQQRPAPTYIPPPPPPVPQRPSNSNAPHAAEINWNDYNRQMQMDNFRRRMSNPSDSIHGNMAGGATPGPGNTALSPDEHPGNQWYNRGYQPQQNMMARYNSQPPVDPRIESDRLWNRDRDERDRLYNRDLTRENDERNRLIRGYQGDTGPVAPQTYNPTMQTYSQSADTNEALSRLRTLSETGGYSDSDISNLRERGISPVRATYANAMRNLERQRGLNPSSGVNYNASLASLTRGLSQGVADQTTNVNAGLADMVARGKASGTSEYAGMSGRLNELMNQIMGNNTAAQNQAGMFNTTNTNNYQNEIARINEDRLRRGMPPINPSIYRSNPDMARRFASGI